ncbi:MAG: helical backbone metal receptor [Polyangiaceae bacterium]
MSLQFRSLGALVLAATFVTAGCRGPERGGKGAAKSDANEPRIVSLHDVTTEIVVALGATERLVGMAELYDATDELRAATAAIEKVEGAESILASGADVVLGLEIVKNKSPDLVASLLAHDKSVHLPALTSVNDVETLIREVARRLKKEKEGEKLVADFSAKVGAKVAAREPKRVFVYDCCDPPFTAGRRTVLSDLIAREGGRNVFADVDAAYTHVSWEEVIARKPEMIVVHAYTDGASPDVSGKLEKLRAIEPLRALPVTVMPLRFSLGGLKTGEAATLLRSAVAGVAGPT